MFALAREVVGKANAGTKVLVVVVRQGSRMGIPDHLQLLVRAAVGLVTSADQVEVLVPADAQVQCESARHLPIVLKIKTQHLGAVLQEEVRVASCVRHPANGTRGSELLRVFRRVRSDY